MKSWVLIIAFSWVGLLAQSNFETARSITYSPVIGALHWKPSAQHGAHINQYYGSGAIYGENVGWILLGDGSPANGIHYLNNSADDYGVNVFPSGQLRGFAYGANIGWIQFDPAGNPRVDWATGRLHGAIYSANIGWIILDDANFYVRLESLASGADVDADGLPDAWELTYASTLQQFNSQGDFDNDRQLDSGEYLAGTSPIDPADYLGLQLTLSTTLPIGTLLWPTKLGFNYTIERRLSFDPATAWTDAGRGRILGTGSPASANVPAGGSSAFFRIKALPPLSP